MEKLEALVYFPVAKGIITNGELLTITLEKNFLYLNEIPKEIIKKDSKNREYFILSSHEDDSLSKELRKKLFDWFIENEIYSIVLVKYEKRKINLCIKHVNSHFMNMYYFSKKYQNLKFINRIKDAQKAYKDFLYANQKKILRRSLSYYRF
jgi:hypothetical protein